VYEPPTPPPRQPGSTLDPVRRSICVEFAILAVSILVRARFTRTLALLVVGRCSRSALMRGFEAIRPARDWRAASFAPLVLVGTGLIAGPRLC